MLIAIYRPSARVIQLINVSGLDRQTRCSSSRVCFDARPDILEAPNLDPSDLEVYLQQPGVMFNYTGLQLRGLINDQSFDCPICRLVDTVGWKPRLPTVISSTSYDVTDFDWQPGQFRQLIARVTRRETPSFSEALNTIMQLISINSPESEAEAPESIPEWTRNVRYAVNSRVRYNHSIWSAQHGNINAQPGLSIAWVYVSSYTEPEQSTVLSHAEPEQAYIPNYTEPGRPAISLSVSFTTGSISEAPVRALPIYGARLVAQGAISENQICPITLEPLALPVQVSNCFHVCSTVDRELPNCPICSQPTYWCVVPVE